jgi:uncharacterized protein YbjT (DUF2867 family)
MTTLVIGANGQIGRIFCKLASESGASIRAMIRDEAQRAPFEALGVEVQVADLEGDFAHTFEGCDRVVFTAGSGGHTGGDKTLLVDLYGAIRAIEESERRGVRHFVMVSALRADEPLAGPPAMRHYFVAKKLADDRLRASSVPYTILRPGRLTDSAASGRVRRQIADGEGFDISRANVAACIAASLSHASAQGQVVDLLDGATRVDELFAG